jgi:tetratricopeptide (TPR) repeat protein
VSALLAALLALAQGPAAPGELAARARELMAAGRYAEAAPLYRALAAAAPASAGRQLNLGMALHLAGASREAVEPLGRARAGLPGSFPAAFYLGAARVKLGELRAALEPLRAAVKLRPDDREARSLLALALESLGRNAQAEPQLAALARLAPDDPAVWLRIGRVYEALARDAFESLLQRAPESAFTLALAASVRRDEGQGDAALELYRAAAARAPRLRGVSAAIAELERAAGRPEEAAAAAARERALAPPDCAREAPECRFAEGKHREVVAAAAGSPRLAAAYWLARSANELAVVAFERLESLPPSLALHEWRAARLRDEGRFAESAAEWRRALALAPSSPRLRQELAISLRLDNDLAGAEAVLEELWRDEPDAASASYLLGDLRLARQRPEAAIPLLEKAVRLDPTLAHAHGALGRAYALVGRPADAVPHLEKALAVDEDGSLRLQLARAYRAAGREADAARALAEWERQRGAAAAPAWRAPKPALTPP